MSEFIWNEDKQTYFQKDNLNGWCVRKDETALGKQTDYEISDGIRSVSCDFLSLNEALSECIRFNKEYPLEQKKT
tara:strand:- start:310 stop:534 length:225 start_codon:yes stop_codon:yes gene_type:complete